MLIALASYIGYTVERTKANSNSYDPLLLDLKLLFSKEYKLGKKAQEIIAKETNIIISENDICTISAILVKHEETNEAIQQFSNFREIFASVTEIIENCYGQKLPEDSVSLKRLERHLYYLMLRSNTTSKYADFPKDNDLLNKIIRKNKKASVCLNEITKYLESKIITILIVQSISIF